MATRTRSRAPHSVAFILFIFAYFALYSLGYSLLSMSGISVGTKTYIRVPFFARPKLNTERFKESFFNRLSFK